MAVEAHVLGDKGVFVSVVPTLLKAMKTTKERSIILPGNPLPSVSTGTTPKITLCSLAFLQKYS